MGALNEKEEAFKRLRELVTKRTEIMRETWALRPEAMAISSRTVPSGVTLQASG